MKFTRTYEVDLYHCDYRKLLLPSFLGRYMHETAYNSLYAYGPDPDDLLRRQLAFVLSRISYRLYRPILAKSVIDVTTWAVPSRGVSFNRFFDVRQNGEKIGNAASVWGLFSLESRSLVRPDESNLPDLSKIIDEDISSVAALERWRMPPQLERLYDYTVGFTDIDINRHLNNVLYMDIIINSVAFGGFDLPFDGKYISQMDINFYKEAAFGRVLAVDRAAEGDTRYIRAGDEKGDVYVESRVMLKPL